MSSFYSEEELKAIGFKSFGKNVLISKKASIYSPQLMEFGDNIRIDDFCILSGRIIIGNFVHIAAASALYGKTVGIEIKDFANISSRVYVYALSDDYSGETMTNPMIPEKYKNVSEDKVTIGRHVIIGSGTTVLQGVNIGEGAAIGAMSLVKKDLAPWGIYAGIPVKKIKDRSKNLLNLEKEFIKETNKK